MPILGPLAQVLREAREQADVLQVDIAARAGVSRSVVSRFETGKNWPEDPDRIVAAYAAECRLDELEIWRRAAGR